MLAVEYPGYGLLHHMEPSEDAVYEVALTAFRFLVDAAWKRMRRTAPEHELWTARTDCRPRKTPSQPRQIGSPMAVPCVMSGEWSGPACECASVCVSSVCVCLQSGVCGATTTGHLGFGNPTIYSFGGLFSLGAIIKFYTCGLVHFLRPSWD